MIHFGIASMTYGGIPMGILQSVSVDINFSTADLYAGGSLFPVDVRTHTGSIEGSAEFADLTSVAFEKLLGGTRTTTSLDFDNTDYPSTFQIVTTLITDSIPFIFTFPKARSTKLSLAMARDQHLIPNFDFKVEADDNGNVFTLDVGDVS